MNLLLVAIGSAGDVHPFVGLGQALLERGHNVTIVTSGYFEPLVRRVGLEFVSLVSVEELQDLLKSPDVWHRWKSFKVVFQRAVLPLVRRTYQLVMDRYESGDMAVVASSLAFGARIAQERHGVPTATVHLQPAMFRSDHECPKLPGLLLPKWLPAPLKRFQFWLADTLVVDRVIGPAVNEFRGELGLPPASRFLADWLHSPTRVIGLFPDWFARRQPDWPPQTVLTGFPRYDELGVTEPAADLIKYLNEGEPPIVFTPGSWNVQGHDFFAEAAGACQRLGRRGLLLTRFPEQIPADLPPGVRHVDYAPFSWLLPRAAAIVHHGGIGTLSQGFAAGIPQLIMPLAHDQPDNVLRAERLGVASSLQPRAFRARAVADKLERLLDSAEVTANCRRVAARFDGHDPIGKTCDLIEQLGYSTDRTAAMTRGA